MSSLALQHYIDNDITLRQLQQRTMMWEDAFDASDYRKLQLHIEKSAMMKRIRFYIRKNRENRKIRENQRITPPRLI
jgi:hypothetical protein